MTAASEARTVERASFAGNAREYFGIWIVNILLTIVTFGIYSAWAKVRRLRYFYGNTVLMGHSFDYHAKGINIFLGRLIVFGLIIVLQVVSVASPIASIVLSLLILLLLPWLMVRSMRFNMRVTSYRNVRFDFVGKTGGAFVALILGGLLSTLSLGLFAPFAARWLYRYIVNNTHYGDRPLSTSVTTGALYRAWLIPAAMVIVGAGLVGAGIYAMMPVAQTWLDGLELDETNEEQMALVGLALAYAIIIPALLLYLFAGIVWRIALRNAVLSASLLDGRHPLVSDAGRARYLWIVLSNTIVVMLTLGLMRPWAAVREWRYLADHTGVIILGDVGDVVGEMVAAGSAASAEYLDLEGFDFGF